MVTEKGKEIAILKALGASDGAILRVFMLEGMIIGGIGTVFGVAVGYATCFGLSWFGVRIDPDVYYIDRLPIAVNGWDFFAVTVAALCICAISTLYPARAASKLLPGSSCRYISVPGTMCTTQCFCADDGRWACVTPPCSG